MVVPVAYMIDSMDSMRGENKGILKTAVKIVLISRFVALIN